MKNQPQYFQFICAHCGAVTNAADVAASLPRKIISTENARRIAVRQTPHAGPGRPKFTRCPGCDGPMSASELRSHRIPCVKRRLEDLRERSIRVHLRPKDPDPYPEFRIEEVEHDCVRFQKLSSDQRLSIEIRKIAEVTLHEQSASIRLFGRVRWVEVGVPGPEWQFTPTRSAGRPQKVASGGPR